MIPSLCSFLLALWLAIASERTGISDRAAAIVTNAVLKDFKIVKPSSSADITDRSKIMRTKKRTRDDSLAITSDVVDKAESIDLYFDGKRDETLSTVKKRY